MSVYYHSGRSGMIVFTPYDEATQILLRSVEQRRLLVSEKVRLSNRITRVYTSIIHCLNHLICHQNELFLK